MKLDSELFFSNPTVSKLPSKIAYATMSNISKIVDGKGFVDFFLVGGLKQTCEPNIITTTTSTTSTTPDVSKSWGSGKGWGYGGTPYEDSPCGKQEHLNTFVVHCVMPVLSYRVFFGF